MSFIFRSFTRADFSLLAEWVARPHVARWWESPRSVDDIAGEYGPLLGSDIVHPFIAWRDGRPRGFVQSYDVMRADPGWWRDETEPGARGIDLFLADESDLGHGLGTEMIAQFVARLFGDPAVTKVQADPSPDNGRAIRAYEKAGFRRAAEIVTPDGPAILMVRRR